MTSKYKDVIGFLFRFLGLYLMLNVIYGLFIEYYSPGYDPITALVTKNAVWILSEFNPHVSMVQTANDASIKILNGTRTIIGVYEGCNSINVIIVFLSFLFAFVGTLKRTLIFMGFGTAMIYLMNLLRILLLYEVAVHFPKNLYFFHKYLFTAIIYGAVFILWYFWIKQATPNESGTTADQR